MLALFPPKERFVAMPSPGVPSANAFSVFLLDDIFKRRDADVSSILSVVCVSWDTVKVVVTYHGH